MDPIVFSCQAILRVPKSKVFSNFRDLNSWNTFQGYGPLPGIQKAVYEKEKETMEGSVIQVHNTDGSQHKEEILKWHPGKLIEVKLYDFQKPLSFLSSHFIERWNFQDTDNQKIVSRTLYMHARNLAAKPLLWCISLLLHRAISEHLSIVAAGK